MKHFPLTAATASLSFLVFSDRLNGADEFVLTPSEPRHEVVGILPTGAFILEGALDPSLTPGGNLQAVAAISFGWDEAETPVVRNTETPNVTLELREGNGLGSWTVWVDGVNESEREPVPKPAGWGLHPEYQRFNRFRQRDGAYRIKIAGIPQGDTTLFRFYFEHFDRPLYEQLVERSFAGTAVHALVPAGNQDTVGNQSRFSLTLGGVTEEDAATDPNPTEVVLRALDYSRPEFAPIAAAVREGNLEAAGRLFLRHMRTRNQPNGPRWEEVSNTVLHPDYRTIAKENLEGRYGNLGWFSQFDSQWTDANGEVHLRVLPDGTINWARENGHLNRHFHWVALAKSYEETGQAKYAKHFSFEVHDWVTREPFFWEHCPQVGGVWLMDGTVFRNGFMNTSNIGRRCELTWWPAYEVFRKSSDFTDEAHFAMLLGFLRQSRLLMNPSSFAAHDDGGAHGSMALLQNALMLPEFRESAVWREEALRRWDEVLKVQFYPDGSHVSGSTGYNWASIYAIQNFLELMKRTGSEIPARFRETLELSLQHPIGISRPDQGQIDMNDGGWGMTDNHYAVAVEKFFPDHPLFQWMATKGEEGSPPAFNSIQYPHAGHLIQRTGWGDDHKYLFLDAGPMGASHGKNDKLNLYLAIGPHQLISSGGRGSYDANPYSAYTGSTYAYNTLLVDDLPQQRVHLKHTHTGHVPEERRWFTSEHFEFMEGTYRSGWHGSEKNVQGVQTRQVVFVKGENPPASSYWVVVDSVEPADGEEHEYKALFHSRRDQATIDPETKAFTCVDHGAGYRILPGNTTGLEVRDVKGQTEPYIQGWHVVGTNKAPMHTAEFSWRATGPTRRIWILEATKLPVEWQVESWSEKEDAFEIVRSDGGVDRIIFSTDDGVTVIKIECQSEGKVVSELFVEGSAP